MVGSHMVFRKLQFAMELPHTPDPTDARVPSLCSTRPNKVKLAIDVQERTSHCLIPPVPSRILGARIVSRDIVNRQGIVQLA